MNDELTTEATATSSTDFDQVANVEQRANVDQVTSDVGIIDELLIEEISIDGMCGVY